MRLYSNQLSGNSYKVRLLIAQLGLDCDVIHVDIFKGESRTADFMGKNVAGQTPVLEFDDGTSLAESNAILWYLAEGSPLRPSAAREEAEVLRWMFFEQNRVMPTVAWARFILRFLPADHPMHVRLPMLQEDAFTALGVLDRHLQGRRFVVGERYTIADIALYGYGHTAAEAGLDLSGTPNVTRWIEAVQSEPHHVPLETEAVTAESAA